MSRASIGFVYGLLGLALSCGSRTGIRTASSDAGPGSNGGSASEPGTGSRRQPSEDGTCPASYGPCGSGKTVTCVLVENDPKNCGACGRTCASGIACVAGICQQRKCTGALRFEKIVSYPPTHPPKYPMDAFYGEYRSADVNRDGHLDFIEWGDGNTHEGQPTIWLGQSDGTFQVGPEIPFDLRGYGAEEDFNEDGIADLVVFDSADHNFSIRPGLPGGGWGAPGNAWPGDTMVIGDLNGDGHLDVLTAVIYLQESKKDKEPPPPQMFELLGRGNGTFASARKLAIDYGGYMRLLDWNGDGILDILFENSVLRIVYGKGDGTFAEDQHCPVGGWSPWVFDLNRDGSYDMLWIPQNTRRLATAFGQGGCNFTPRTDYVLSFEPLGFVLGDLDGDGLADVLVGSRIPDPSSYGLRRDPTTLTWLTGRADGTLAPQADLGIPWPEDGFGPIIADVNGDGRVDIVNSGRAGIEVYANTCAQIVEP